MCLPGQPSPGAVPVPATAAEAVAMAEAGLGWLADADFTALTTGEQADCLRGLERAESRKTAAQARALSAFRASDGCRDDGHSSPRTWLRWKTRITPGAATGAMRWMRRLSAHPLVRGALADARISESWAKQICAWTDKSPPRSVTTPTRSCSPPPAAAWTSTTSPPWPKRSSGRPPGPTPTARMTGLMTGR